MEGLPEENSGGEIKVDTAQNFISVQKQQIERPRGGVAEVDDDFVGITMAGSISDTMPLSGKRSLTVRKITIIQDEWSKGSSVYNGSKSAGIITLDKAK